MAGVISLRRFFSVATYRLPQANPPSTSQAGSYWQAPPEFPKLPVVTLVTRMAVGINTTFALRPLVFRQVQTRSPVQVSIKPLLTH